MIDPGTRNVLMISGTLLLVSAGVYMALYTHTSSLRSEVEELGVVLEKERSTSSGEQASGHLLRQIEEERRAIRSFFLSEDDIPELISFLEDEARLASVSSRIVSVEVQEAAAPEVVINISVEGEWDGVIHYTALLENMPFQLEIETTSFTRRIEEGGWRVTYMLTAPLVDESI